MTRRVSSALGHDRSLPSDYSDPSIYAIPLYLVTLALEPRWLARQRSMGHANAGYEKRDTQASLGMGLGSIIPVSLINFAIYAVAVRLWHHRLVDLGSGAAGWAVALLGWDLAYYWHHRFEHENRVLWACHVSHHSSRLFNLSTALRQPWTPVAGVILYPPLALLGVAPWMIMASGGVNLVYQYWIHTEGIARLPAWFELVFNTPSHHRVHHGSNPEYLDKNYGGVLIVWDRAFGTFEPECAKIAYGLTKNLETFDVRDIVLHEYRDIARDLLAASTLRERVAIVVSGPGRPTRPTRPNTG